MASQIRGKNGNFVPKTKLNVLRHHVRTKKLLLPIVALVAVVGGIVIYTSQASSYMACSKKDNYYKYSESCVVASEEASVVRMYYATLDRAPDSSGLTYWKNKIRNGTKLVSMADQFLASNEYKTKNGTLSNAAFVNAVYGRAFERQPDSSGAQYWIKQLDSKSSTRGQMVASLVQSSEMKEKFSTRVALALGIPYWSFTKERVNIPLSSQTCFGTVSTDGSGQKWCNVKIPAGQGLQVIAIVGASLDAVSMYNSPGTYYVCSDYSSTNMKPDNAATKTFAFASTTVAQGDISNGSGVSRDSLGGGGYSNKPSFTCGSATLLPSAMNSLVYTANVQNQSANATASVNMSTLSIAKPVVDTSVQLTEAFDPARLTQFNSTYDYTLNVKGKNVNVVSKPRSPYVLDSSTRPAWVHQSGYVQGENVILYDIGTRGESVFKLNLTNSLTGKPITGYKVKRTQMTSAGRVDNIIRPNSVGEYTWSANYQYDELSVEFDVPQPTKVRAELNFVKGSMFMYSSGVRSKKWY